MVKAKAEILRSAERSKTFSKEGLFERLFAIVLGRLSCAMAIAE
jgi:hypothetical protein